MLAILQAPPCVPNVLVMHSGFSTAFGKDRAAATMWMCGNPRLGRVYPDGPRSFTANFICLPGVKRPLTALETHFPFFAACSVVSPPLGGRGQMFGPYFGYPPGHRPHFIALVLAVYRFVSFSPLPCSFTYGGYLVSIFFASESRRTDHPLCTSFGLSIVIWQITWDWAASARVR